MGARQVVEPVPDQTVGTRREEAVRFRVDRVASPEDSLRFARIRDPDGDHRVPRTHACASCKQLSSASTRLSTLPVLVLGRAGTTEMTRGALYPAIRSRQNRISSCGPMS